MSTSATTSTDRPAYPATCNNCGADFDANGVAVDCPAGGGAPCVNYAARFMGARTVPAPVVEAAHPATVVDHRAATHDLVADARARISSIVDGVHNAALDPDAGYESVDEVLFSVLVELTAAYADLIDDRPVLVCQSLAENLEDR